MKKIVSILLSGLIAVSCIDTVILPDDKTVEEDFWQTKEEVSMMVRGAYLGFASSGLQQRFVVWTMRADELNVNQTLNNSNLNQIYSANIQTTNSYSSWADLYSIINRCNLVIDKSAEVMSIDPNYMEGDHMNNVGQMKALRSLCYFYLVRVFRDVPLILEPYKQSSQEMNVPQVAPAVVIDQIIADLEEAKGMVLSSSVITDNLSACNYFTSDGVLALLADVYLWKASIYGDESCYDRCIQCCDAIRASRQVKYGTLGNMLQFDDDGFGLFPCTVENYFNQFIPRTGMEALFELSDITDANGLCIVYNKNTNSSNALPLFYASPCYSKVETEDKYLFNHDDYKTYDVRGYESVYDFNAGEEGFFVRKFVAQQAANMMVHESTVLKSEIRGNRNYSNYNQNWIFYRVSDVMLMKAEAMVEKARLIIEANRGLADRATAAVTTSDSLDMANRLAEVNKAVERYFVSAVRCAQIVNSRARIDQKAVATIDSTKYQMPSIEYTGENLKTYFDYQALVFKGFEGYDIDAIEKLVMDERARELCFEGKRWFDMLRYNYRHVQGVDYGTILAQQGGAFAENYDVMLDIVANKYISGEGAAVKAKMPTEPYLYMPIIQSEMDVNPALMQNPVYFEGNSMEKN